MQAVNVLTCQRATLIHNTIQKIELALKEVKNAVTYKTLVSAHKQNPLRRNSYKHTPCGRRSTWKRIQRTMRLLRFMALINRYSCSVDTSELSKQIRFEEVDIIANVCPKCGAKLLLPMSVLPYAFCPKCGTYYTVSFECRYCHKLFRRLGEEALCPDCLRRFFMFGEN